MSRSASHWLEVLRTTETADRRWKAAVNALAAMGLLPVPALIEATGDDHPEVRRGANQALYKIGPATIPFWMKALRHENSLVREAAARGLYGLAPHAQKAIPALTDALCPSMGGHGTPEPCSQFRPGPQGRSSWTD